MVQTVIEQLRTAEAKTLSVRGQRPVKPGPRNLYQWFVLHWEAFWIGAILLVAGLADGINMFNYPIYLDDEGIYTSAAWAVLKEGQLDAYTYTYGHAPLGWIQIAVWNFVTGGVHTFGMAINSGRVLMLLMQIGSTFLLYRIARSISKSVAVATIACVLFALSPYGIYLHRRVLLDNIATFWMLLSILLLVCGRFSLTRGWLSATALGISILSKEISVVLVPVLIYLVFLRADRSHRWFAILGWVALVGSIVSMYPLLATLKGELFPRGTLLGGTNPHVSLIGSLLWHGDQSSGGSGGGAFDFNNNIFWQMTRFWAQAEPLLVIGGSLFALICVLLMKRQRIVGVIGVVTLSLWAFFWHYGFALEFYLIPLLPLLALNIALVLGVGINNLNTFLKRDGGFGLLVSRGVRLIAIGLCLIGLSISYFSPILGLQSNKLVLWNSSRDGVAQREAIDWIRKNIPSCSSIIVDPYMWTDLHDSPNGGNGYRLAHSYWQVALDPAITDKVFHDDWRNIDYVAVTPGLLYDTNVDHLPLVQDALAHSTPVAQFDMLGWPIEIRQVNKNTGRSENRAGTLSGCNASR